MFNEICVKGCAYNLKGCIWINPVACGKGIVSLGYRQDRREAERRFFDGIKASERGFPIVALCARAISIFVTPGGGWGAGRSRAKPGVGPGNA